MATGPGHMPPGRLRWQQGLAKWHHGGWDGNRAWPHGTRVACMASLSGCMALGWLGWQQGLAIWHQGDWDGNRADHVAPGWL